MAYKKGARLLNDTLLFYMIVIYTYSADSSGLVYHREYIR